METPPPPPPHGYQHPQEPSRPKKSPVLWILIGLLGLCTCTVPILAAILFPVFSQAKQAAINTRCLSNVKITTLGALIYAGDYDDHFPKAAVWSDVTKPYVEAQASHCPADKSGGGFAFADAMSNALAAKIKDLKNQVVIYETNREGQNVHGNPQKEHFEPRHGKQNLGYADGHAKSIKP